MLDIKILGIGCRKSRVLKANLMMALESMALEFSIGEVIEVEEILTYDIEAAPALLIEGRAYFQGVVPDLAELAELLKIFSRPVITK